MADKAEDREIPTSRDTNGDVIEELTTQLEALAEFDKNCQTQLINAAKMDNNLLMAEFKGMLRVIVLLGQQINSRVETLKKKDMH